jgi:hypothetical protein
MLLLRKALWRARELRLDDQLTQLLRADALQEHEDRRVVVEVRGREVDVWVVGEQSLLGAKVLDASCEDLTLGAPNGCWEPCEAVALLASDGQCLIE